MRELKQQHVNVLEARMRLLELLTTSPFRFDPWMRRRWEQGFRSNFRRMREEYGIEEAYHLHAADCLKHKDDQALAELVRELAQDVYARSLVAADELELPRVDP